MQAFEILKGIAFNRDLSSLNVWDFQQDSAVYLVVAVPKEIAHTRNIQHK